MLLPALTALGGVAATRVLQGEHGVHEREVRAAVARGDIVRVRQGWVALPSADPDVVAAVRVGGVLSCTSVLRHSRVWTDHDHGVHVRVPSNVGRLSSPHDRRRPLEPRHSVTVHRPQWASITPSPVDDSITALAVAIACQPRLSAISTLDSALNLGLTTVSALHDAFAPLPAKYRAYLSFVDPTSQSGLETKTRLALRSKNVRLRSQLHIPRVGKVDLVVGERLVLELDGYEWHSRKADFEEDRRRDRELTAQNYQVLRLSYEQVTNDWPGCEEAILGLIRRRKHLWPRSSRRTV